jgi:dTDP-4-dehydrorhamnose reductase
MTPVLVIGRAGQLALSLAERAAARNLVLSFAGREAADLERPDSLRRCIGESGASIVINAAAHTAVDQAEDEPEPAEAVNATAPRVMAEAARAAGARLVHMSTDYVFGGQGDRPWTEEDQPAPLGVYGRTKWRGEEAVREMLPDHVIVRTAWLYSPFGRNFVKTMLAAAESRDELRVVGDQVGNPSSALDVAEGLLTMISGWDREPGKGLGATYHLTGQGAASWADFAREIFSISVERGGPSAKVRAIPSSEWPAKAPRPANSRLDSARFGATSRLFRSPLAGLVAEGDRTIGPVARPAL